MLTCIFIIVTQLADELKARRLTYVIIIYSIINHLLIMR